MIFPETRRTAPNPILASANQDRDVLATQYHYACGRRFWWKKEGRPRRFGVGYAIPRIPEFPATVPISPLNFRAAPVAQPGFG